MIYQESKPTKKLQPYIHSYWEFEVDPDQYKKPFQHTILADGCISLVFITIPNQPLFDPMLVGPTIRNLEVKVFPGATYRGARFIPPSPCGFFGITGLELRDKKISAAPYIKRLNIQPILDASHKDGLFFERIDKVFEEYINAKSIEQNHSVFKTVQKIMKTDGNIRISEIVDSSPMSERHLQRQFKKLVGLTPKEFARIRRIRATVIQTMLEEQNPSEAIYKSGYFDRPHYNHEFSLIVGKNPSSFKKYIDQIKHIDVE